MISNRNFKIANGVVLILLIIAISYLYNKSGYKKSIDVITKDNYANQTHTIDSLKNVVDSLQIEIFQLEDGFDYGLIVNTNQLNESVVWFWFTDNMTTVKKITQFNIEKPL